MECTLNIKEFVIKYSCDFDKRKNRRESHEFFRKAVQAEREWHQYQN